MPSALRLMSVVFWAKRATAGPPAAAGAATGSPASAASATASASRSIGSPGWETSSAVAGARETPCCTTWASSCAIRSRPPPDAGAYSSLPKTMSGPTV